MIWHQVDNDPPQPMDIVVCISKEKLVWFGTYTPHHGGRINGLPLKKFQAWVNISEIYRDYKESKKEADNGRETE